MQINTDCSAFYPALEPYYNTGEYPFIRVGDVKDIVNYDDCIKIPEEILLNYPTLKKVDIGDIVLTKGGSIGIAGYITQPACVSRDHQFYLNRNAFYYTSIYLLSSHTNNLSGQVLNVHNHI